MSLVNDALKRAKQSQPKNPIPAAGPAFRLPETTPRSHNHQDALFVSVVLVILLLGGFLLWQWSNGGGGELQVRARTFPVASAAVSAKHISLIPVQPAGTMTAPTAAPDNAAAAAPDATATDGTAPAPQPVAFKLQSVLYLPGDPSAVINGKVVHVHSSINDARVVAIVPGKVTLVTANGQTNVLAMPDDIP